MTSPYQVTKDFETELCKYTGAPYAVCLSSCTAALQLAVQWALDDHISNVFEIPRRTYVSVPCAIKNAGGFVGWRDEDWRGAYQLKPFDIWDCARRFTSGMYKSGQFQCVSFSTTKILGIEQGGAILHDNAEADKWFRKMRFDGRTEGVDPADDTFDVVGHHMIMLPSIAAQLILKLHHLPLHNDDLPDYPYPDLSVHPAFK
jgi:dTDP-4-amino-4,6-dideoxygalactose transaminase